MESQVNFNTEFSKQNKEMYSSLGSTSVGLLAFTSCELGEFSWCYWIYAMEENLLPWPLLLSEKHEKDWKQRTLSAHLPEVLLLLSGASICSFSPKMQVTPKGGMAFMSKVKMTSEIAGLGFLTVFFTVTKITTYWPHVAMWSKTQLFNIQMNKQFLFHLQRGKCSNPLNSSGGDWPKPWWSGSPGALQSVHCDLCVI